MKLGECYLHLANTMGDEEYYSMAVKELNKSRDSLPSELLEFLESWEEEEAAR